jgi:prevent-host-death family protein
MVEEILLASDAMEGTMTRMSSSQIREEFAEALNRVIYKGERIVLRRRGKTVAALISIEDLEGK